MNSIQYLGHSSFLITLDDIVCLIDPVISKKINGSKRLIPSSLNISMKRCDLILITHEQAEHCEPETIKTIAQRTYASVIGPKPVLAKIDIAQKFKVDVRVGDKFSIKGLDIEVTKAVHPQAVYPVGYIMKGSKWRVYHAGDSYSFSTLYKIKCDIAILPIGGTYTMDSFAAANACKEIRPKYAIPCSYNTTERVQVDLSEFKNSLPSYTKPIILKPGAIAKLS